MTDVVFPRAASLAGACALVDLIDLVDLILGRRAARTHNGW
jgi:hypothetical protein